MAGILAAIGSVTKILDTVSDSNDKTSLAVLKALKSKEVKLLKSDGSIMKLLGSYIIEPTIVISNDLKNEDVIEKLVTLESDMFAGYYLQAFNVLANVYNLESSVTFDSLSTDTGGLKRAVLAGTTMALEERDYLKELYSDNFNLSIEAVSNDDPSTNDYEFDLQHMQRANIHNDRMANDSTQKAADRTTKNTHHSQDLEHKQKELALKKRDFNLKNTRQYIAGVSEVAKDLYIPAGIQRYIDVTMTSNGKTVVIPVLIKANILFTSTDNVLNILKTNGYEKTFGARLDDYRSGAISLIDLVLAGDIVKEYKHNKIADKDGLLKLIKAREISSNSKMLDNKFAGFEKYYNMYIVTEADKIRIESRLKGKLKNNKYKEIFLEQAFGLSLTIVDRDYERIKIMMKDVTGTTDMNYKALNKMDKKGGGDVEEIVKALMLNKTPTF